MTLGEKIQSIRKGNQLSQEEFADKIGVSRQAVSKWELNDSVPELEKIAVISRIFHVSVDSIVHEAMELKDTEEDGRPVDGPGKLEKTMKRAGTAAKKHGYLAGYILIILGVVNFITAALLGVLWFQLSNALSDFLLQFNLSLNLQFLFWIFVVMAVFAAGVLAAGVAVVTKGKKAALRDGA